MKIDKSMVLLGLMAALALAVFFGVTKFGGPGVNGGNGAARTAGKPLIGGRFSLTDHTGKRVTEKDYRGKYQLIYFGYTYCPEICPTSLQSVADAMELLGKSADDITPLFITVDPARDTVEQMASYVENFHERMVGLTGTPEETRAAIKAYRVYSKKVVTEDAIDFDHSALTFFMDREGNYITHFDYGVQGEKMAKKIKTILAADKSRKVSSLPAN